jgi:hypothetical protein
MTGLNSPPSKVQNWEGGELFLQAFQGILYAPLSEKYVLAEHAEWPSSVRLVLR